MVELTVDQSLSVTVTRNQSDRCVYTIVFEGDEVVQYDTSADPRTDGGRIGLRNVIRRNVPGYETSVIDSRLIAEIETNAEALMDELGTRETN